MSLIGGCLLRHSRRRLETTSGSGAWRLKRAGKPCPALVRRRAEHNSSSDALRLTKPAQRQRAAVQRSHHPPPLPVRAPHLRTYPQVSSDPERPPRSVLLFVWCCTAWPGHARIGPRGRGIRPADAECLCHPHPSSDAACARPLCPVTPPPHRPFTEHCQQRAAGRGGPCGAPPRAGVCVAGKATAPPPPPPLLAVAAVAATAGPEWCTLVVNSSMAWHEGTRRQQRNHASSSIHASGRMLFLFLSLSSSSGSSHGWTARLNQARLTPSFVAAPIADAQPQPGRLDIRDQR